jgi:hypothetical protein
MGLNILPPLPTNTMKAEVKSTARNKLVSKETAGISGKWY